MAGPVFFSTVGDTSSTIPSLKIARPLLKRQDFRLNRLARTATEKEFRVEIKLSIMHLLTTLLAVIHRLLTVLLILVHGLLTVFLIMIHLLFAYTLGAQTPDTVRPGKGHLLTTALKPGLRQYLVTFQDPKNSRQLRFWYWMRDIDIQTHKGQKVFAITQHWYGSDTLAYRSIYSLNAADDFAPLYHRENVRGKTAAYNWDAKAIAGADTVDGNAKKGFSLAFSEPNYNWNLDIETFEMLPLAAGKSFLINFYDAGLDPPKYVLYSVTGSETLSLMDGAKTDCWKLYTEGTDPRGGKYSETYWISKKGHEFLKEEDSFSGMVRYKIKMPGLTPDLLPRFAR